LSTSTSEQEKKDHALLKQLEKAITEKQWLLEGRLNQKKAELEKQYSSQIEAGRHQKEKAEHLYNGWSAVFQHDGLLAAGGALAFAAIGTLFSGMTLLDAGLCGLILGLSGAAGGLLAGRRLRRMKIVQAAEPLLTAESQIKQQTEALKNELEEEIEDLRRQAKMVRTRLGKIEQQLAEIETWSTRSIQTAKETTEKKIAELWAQAEKEVAGMVQNLLGSIKSLSAESSYPMLKIVKAAGYKSGERPPSDYGDEKLRRFIQSLPFEQQQRLALLARILSNEQFNQLLKIIYKMSSYERGQFLSQLI